VAVVQLQCVCRFRNLRPEEVMSAGRELSEAKQLRHALRTHMVTTYLPRDNVAYLFCVVCRIATSIISTILLCLRVLSTLGSKR